MSSAKLLGCAALFCLLALQVEAAERPNILYIFTDQQFADAMSCAGNPYARTPAIDRIAKRGMRFANAYCASPVCSPSRGSMFTGLFPHQHGVTVNNTRIDTGLSEICLARLLDRKGYECVYAGKWHLPGGAMTKTDLKQHPYRILAGPSDERVSDTCAQFLAEKRDRPFFLVASYMNPHDICLWAMDRPKGYQKHPVPESPTEDCPTLPENFGVPGDEPSVLREFYMARHVEQKSFDRERWRQYLHAYYWMLETVDSDIGRLLDALEAGGLDRNTLIVFSSDHGDGLAAHQWLGKCCHYEEAVRVPFIVCLEDVIEAGQVDDSHLVSSGPDFYATALDYAGIDLPPGCRGRSLREILEGTPNPKSWRDQVVTEIWVPGNTPKRAEGWKSAWGRMVRTESFKYALYDRGDDREQLFDLDADPGEMHNLAGDPKYGKILNEHRRRLARWCQETEDATFLPHLVAAE